MKIENRKNVKKELLENTENLFALLQSSIAEYLTKLDLEGYEKALIYFNVLTNLSADMLNTITETKDLAIAAIQEYASGIKFTIEKSIEIEKAH